MLFSKRSGAIDYIVVGLGNPGMAYEGTRHNAGCDALAALAKDAGIDVSKKQFKALVGTGVIEGKKVLLMFLNILPCRYSFLKVQFHRMRFLPRLGVQNKNHHNHFCNNNKKGLLYCRLTTLLLQRISYIHNRHYYIQKHSPILEKRYCSIIRKPMLKVLKFFSYY